VISNLSQAHIVQITAGPPGSPNLTLAPQCGTIALPAGGYPAGSVVVRAQHSIFFISTAFDGNPTLMMNPTGNPALNLTAGEPLAEGIEDMQVALGWDQGAPAGSVVPDSPVAGADGWYGNVAGEPVITSITLRAVRITLIARTLSSYIGGLSPFVRPAAEDHAAGTVGDQYRRRVLKTTAEIRNVGESP
jgi:Type IV Pilus-assembly protein W